MKKTSTPKSRRKRNVKDLSGRKVGEVTGGTAVKAATPGVSPASDRPTEEVAFYYNKIAFNYASSPDGR